VRRDERIVLSVASLGHALCHVSTLVLQQVIFEASRDLKTASIGWLVTLGAVLVGAGAIPSGALGDRFGNRRMYAVYLALLAVAGATAAAARDVALFAPAVALVGLAASFHHPVGLAWLSEAIPEQRARALGIHGFVGHFGSTLAPLLVLRIHQSVGWRQAYAVVAVAAALLFAALRLAPRTAAERGAPAIPADALGNAPTKRSIPWRLALVPAMVILMVAMTPNGLVHQGFWSSWTSFVKDETGATPHSGPGAAALSLAPLAEQAHAVVPAWLRGAAKEGESALGPIAGALATLVLAFGSIGELFGGHWARRGATLRLYAAMNAASAVGLAGLCFLRGPALLVAGALFAFFHFGTQPVENDLVARRVDPRVRGLAYGLKFVVTFGIGGLVSVPTIAGWEAFGFTPVFAALGAIALLSALFVAWLGRREKRGALGAVSAAPPAPRAP
jgi:MFS family permease